jgi:hypothetical protein
MTASGAYGDIRVCAGIVGNADCTIGDAIKEVLEACIEAFVPSLCDCAAEMNGIFRPKQLPPSRLKAFF